ncbi:MAG: prepilin peptidase [Ruminococcus sp.]|nr:prepilin peptidase [Ruminococcus sp.]
MYYFCYTILYVIIFLFGTAIGSFLNVCIYRLPKEESIVRVLSHCMTCGAQIQKRDLIPIFSWLRLRGKCRSCGTKISARYTLVVALNAVCYVLIFAWFGIFEQPLTAALVCLLFSALIVVFFMDLDTQLISLFVIGAIALLGMGKIVLDLVTHEGTLLSHRIGALAAFVPLMLLVLLSGERAMGRGDAELMLTAGLFLGVKRIVVALFLGLILGSVCGLIRKARTGDSKLAFGPYLSLGIAIAVFVGEPIADWFLRLCGF